MIDLILLAEGAVLLVAVVAFEVRRRREAREVDRFSRALSRARTFGGHQPRGDIHE